MRVSRCKFILFAFFHGCTGVPTIFNCASVLLLAGDDLNGREVLPTSTLFYNFCGELKLFQRLEKFYPNTHIHIIDANFLCTLNDGSKSYD